LALCLTMLPCAGSRGRFGDNGIPMSMSFGAEAERRTKERCACLLHANPEIGFPTATVKPRHTQPHEKEHDRGRGACTVSHGQPRHATRGGPARTPGVLPADGRLGGARAHTHTTRHTVMAARLPIPTPNLPPSIAHGACRPARGLDHLHVAAHKHHKVGGWCGTVCGVGLPWGAGECRGEEASV